MAVSERPPDDGTGEYSPRQMLERAQVRHGPELRGETNAFEMSYGGDSRYYIYSESEQDAWISSACAINRVSMR